MGKKRKDIPHKVRIFDSVSGLADSAAETISNEVIKAIADNRSCYIALSGGNTPRVVYERLAEEPYATKTGWENVHLFWGDERCVPPGHPDSNFKMVSDALLGRISIPGENVHRIMGENRPDKEADRYIGEIENAFGVAKGHIPRFDLVLLGLGNDGHTASLFPGSPSLDEKEKICTTSVHPESGRKRVTLTLVLINAAARVLFLVTGKEKSGIVQEILNRENGYLSYPAAKVKPVDGSLEWFLDRNAAGDKELEKNKE